MTEAKSMGWDGKDLSKHLLVYIKVPGTHSVSSIGELIARDAYRTILPVPRHLPVPPSPHVTIHRPTTSPRSLSVSATVSSVPGAPALPAATASSDAGGSCTARGSSHFANGRGVATKKSASYTRVVRRFSARVSVVISRPWSSPCAGSARRSTT